MSFTELRNTEAELVPQQIMVSQHKPFPSSSGFRATALSVWK